LPDMKFLLRPQRNNLDYVHRSYPSVLIRKSDLDALGMWDGVSANADDEFVQRARILWGKNSVKDILTGVPLSFFLVHENSLTQSKKTSLNSLTFGVRYEYSRQAKFWRENVVASDAKSIVTDRISLKAPFPIPAGLAPNNWNINSRYDLVIVSDLSLLGGTRRCNEGYINAAINSGLRVGLFHWPRYDLALAEIAPEYTELSYHNNVDILVHEDEITANLVVIHHPPILSMNWMHFLISSVKQLLSWLISLQCNCGQNNLTITSRAKSMSSASGYLSRNPCGSLYPLL